MSTSVAICSVRKELIHLQIQVVYFLIYEEIKAKMSVVISNLWPTRRNGKTSGFGNHFWLFKIASRKPCWVSVMNFCKRIVKHSWV